MKLYIKQIILLLALSVFLGACEDEVDIIQIAPVSIGAISTPTQGDTFTLNPFENSANTAITISWDDADYGYQVAINYSIEFALSGTDFANGVVVGTTTTNYFLMNISELNAASVGVGLFPFVEGSVDIRIVSDLGPQSSLPQHSESISVLVTPFTTNLPTIAVPGNHQGWDPGTAEQLSASAFGASDYEGYVWLDGEYKFLSPDSSGGFDWGTTDWGDDGTFSGLLVADDEVNCTATAGYYLLTVDTDALTYTQTPYDWGIIGSATPGGWDSDQDMIYDPITRTLTITLDLTADELKFRANDAWTVNYGDTGANGELSQDGDNIAIPAAGNYTVVLDLSTPREYTYSLTLN